MVLWALKIAILVDCHWTNVMLPSESSQNRFVIWIQTRDAKAIWPMTTGAIPSDLPVSVWFSGGCDHGRYVACAMTTCLRCCAKQMFGSSTSHCLNQKDESCDDGDRLLENLLMCKHESVSPWCLESVASGFLPLDNPVSSSCIVDTRCDPNVSLG